MILATLKESQIRVQIEDADKEKGTADVVALFGEPFGPSWTHGGWCYSRRATVKTNSLEEFEIIPDDQEPQVILLMPEFDQQLVNVEG